MAKLVAGDVGFRVTGVGTSFMGTRPRGRSWSGGGLVGGGRDGTRVPPVGQGRTSDGR